MSNFFYKQHMILPQHIDELAGVVRVSDRVWIPLDFQSLQVSAVLCQTNHNLVNVYTGRHLQEPAIGCSYHHNPMNTKNKAKI